MTQPAAGRDESVSAAPWYARTSVLFLLIGVSVVGLGFWTPLFDVDEGAFTEATREMLVSGNWVSTTLNGEPRHDKPILIYWLQGVSVSLLGQGEGAWRLPSMLASLAWIGLVWRFCNRTYGRTTGVLAIWALVACWQTSIIFKAAIADALLNALLCWILLGLVDYLREPATRKLFVLGIGMGLAFLTKGPVALVIPLGSVFLALLATGQLRRFWQAVLHPAAWLTVLAVIVPWHVASYLDQGWAFFEGFYLGHNLGRFSDTMESHGGQLWYYLIMLPVIVLPFCTWLPGLLMQGYRTLLAREDVVDVFLWSWFLLTFLIFSVSRTQLPHYLVYGLTPLFILLARRIEGDSGLSLWRALPGICGTALLLLFPLALPYVSAPDEYVQGTLDLGYAVFLSTWPWLVAALVGCVLGLVAAARAGGLSLVLASALALVVSANFVAMPLVAAAQQAPVKRAGLLARGLPADTRLTAWRIRMPSFSVYAQAVVPERDPKPGDVIFTRVHKIEALAEHTEGALEEVFREGGVALLRLGSTGEEANSKGL